MAADLNIHLHNIVHLCLPQTLSPLKGSNLILCSITDFPDSLMHLDWTWTDILVNVHTLTLVKNKGEADWGLNTGDKIRLLQYFFFFFFF